MQSPSKKISCFLGAGLLLFGLLITESAAQIVFIPDKIDLGSVWQGDSFHRKFIIKNIGNKILQLDRFAIPPELSIRPEIQKIIEPGQEAIFRIKINLKGVSGPFVKIARVHTLLSDYYIADLQISGSVSNLISPQPAYVKLNNLEKVEGKILFRANRNIVLHKKPKFLSVSIEPEQGVLYWKVTPKLLLNSQNKYSRIVLVDKKNKAHKAVVPFLFRSEN